MFSLNNKVQTSLYQHVLILDPLYLAAVWILLSPTWLLFPLIDHFYHRLKRNSKAITRGLNGFFTEVSCLVLGTLELSTIGFWPLWSRCSHPAECLTKEEGEQHTCDLKLGLPDSILGCFAILSMFSHQEKRQVEARPSKENFLTCPDALSALTCSIQTAVLRRMMGPSRLQCIYSA